MAIPSHVDSHGSHSNNANYANAYSYRFCDVYPILNNFFHQMCNAII